MTCDQFIKALNRANIVKFRAICELKKLDWENFSITLSFKEEIDDSEEISDYSAFTYVCNMNGIKKYVALPMETFVNDKVAYYTIADMLKDYFIKEFSSTVVGSRI